MGKSPVNTALGTVRGKVDDWVYRNVEGETVVARRPRAFKGLPTQSQEGVRERFRRAVLYAQAVFADPVRKEAYRVLAEAQGIKSRLFGFVVRDFAQPPVVTGMDLSHYQRQIGDHIRVYAKDDAEVTGVSVRLKAANGTVIEEGGAVRTDAYWRYEATTDVLVGGPITVEAMAADRAENVTTRTEVIP